MVRSIDVLQWLNGRLFACFKEIESVTRDKKLKLISNKILWVFMSLKKNLYRQSLFVQEKQIISAIEKEKHRLVTGWTLKII